MHGRVDMVQQALTPAYRQAAFGDIPSGARGQQPVQAGVAHE